MATTKELTLTQRWKACATGEGDVTLTTADEAYWIISDTAATPTLTYGHLNRTGDSVSMRLLAGERLWLKGNGAAAVTADHPLT